MVQCFNNVLFGHLARSEKRFFLSIKSTENTHWQGSFCEYFYPSDQRKHNNRLRLHSQSHIKPLRLSNIKPFKCKIYWSAIALLPPHTRFFHQNCKIHEIYLAEFMFAHKYLSRQILHCINVFCLHVICLHTFRSHKNDHFSCTNILIGNLMAIIKANTFSEYSSNSGYGPNTSD